MMVTNAVLGGVADTVAQLITAVRQRAVRKPGGVRDDDTFAIEIHELDTKNPLQSRQLIPNSKVLPPPFDFERLARFMGYGFMMAPVQLKWFQFLQKSFPITKSSGLAPTLKRVACDQLIFAPAGMRPPSLLQAIKSSILINLVRNCTLLYGHDCCGRRWKTGCCP
jgi:protein Mpv17